MWKSTILVPYSFSTARKQLTVPGITYAISTTALKPLSYKFCSLPTAEITFREYYRKSKRRHCLFAGLAAPAIGAGIAALTTGSVAATAALATTTAGTAVLAGAFGGGTLHL